MRAPNIELYEILIATAESKNLVQAAEKLKISQPAVSVKLKALESQTPLPLFSYEGKRKVLTHYGRELYRIAKANQQNLASAYEALNRQYASAETLTLKVGARRELFEALAPRLKFGGKVLFRSATSTEAVDWLREHKIDIAITYIKPDSPEIVAKKILDSTATFVIHRDLMKGLKAGEDLIYDKEFIRNTPCVFYQEDGHLLSEWVAHLGLTTEDLKPRAVCDDWRSVQTFVNDRWGYGIVPSYVVPPKDVISIPMPHSVLPKYVFYALFRKDLKKVPAFKNILEV
jgi:DNA-binding transcriptional LysR family regulator